MTQSEALVIGWVAPAELDTVCGWLNDPAVAGPLLVVPPSRSQLEAGRLQICDGDEVEEVEAGLIAVRWQGNLIGVAIDYGWDFATDTIREMDIAVPGDHPRTTGFLLEVTARLIHFEFVELGARYVRTSSPRQRTRQYGRMGGNHEGELRVRRPDNGEWCTRQIYGVTRDAFYSSALVADLGLSSPSSSGSRPSTT